MFRFGGHRKQKKEKERKVWVHRRRVTFVTRKVVGRKTTSIDKSGLKRKSKL